MESVSEMMEHRDLQISVVIPAHNEAKNLPYVLPLIPTWVHEVILVNDQSVDNTVEVARRVLPSIHIINTHGGRGKGAALRSGFAATTGDIVVMMDADGSSDPREIPRFIEALQAGAYFVIGSRFIANGGSSDITHLRRFGAHMLISIANQLFQLRLTDMFCGLNAFWKDCLDFFKIDCDGFNVEALIILRAYKANLEIVEVPSYEHARIHGTSNFHTFQDGWRVLKTIMKEWKNGRSVVAKVRKHRLYQQENVVWDGLVITENVSATQ